MPFSIIREDLTKIKADAIVDPINPKLDPSGGASKAIFETAGYNKMQNACKHYIPLKYTETILTPGFHLPAQFVIHTASPLYDLKDKDKSLNLLEKTYQNIFDVALKHKFKSIALPLISSGSNGYPKKEAFDIAIHEIKRFLDHEELEIVLAVFDTEAFTLSQKLLSSVQSYVDENYIDEKLRQERVSRRIPVDEFEDLLFESTVPNTLAPKALSLEEQIENLDEPFNVTLLKLIDEKGMSDSEVYKRANISRKLFSKIRTGKGYMPSKKTIIALAFALKLSLEETEALLEKAGYALSHSQKFDVIIEYFLIHNIDNLYTINEVLFKYDQPLLGSSQ